MSDHVEGVGEVTVKDTEEYGASNGIALYSTNGDTVNNYSDISGQTYISYRIKWTVTSGASDGTPGSLESGNGITGQGWFLDTMSSPFFGKDSDTIVNDALTNRNLNSYFDSWYAGDTQEVSDKITEFVRTPYVISCVDFYPVS